MGAKQQKTFTGNEIKLEKHIFVLNIEYKVLEDTIKDFQTIKSVTFNNN